MKALVCLIACSLFAAPRLCAAEPGKYQGPAALAVSADGRTLYVVSADARQVAWVDTKTSQVARRVDVPARPSGLALSPDGTKLFVACAAPRSSVAVLDARSGQALAAISVGHTAVSPAVSPDGKRLFVCNRFQNDVSVIDIAAGRELTRLKAVREPIVAAVAPDGRTLLVANHLPNQRADAGYKVDVAPTIMLFDTRTFQVSLVELTHGANSVRGVCFTPDGRHAFVTHLLSNFESIPFRVDTGWINTNVISIIDVPGRKLVRTIGMDDYDLGAGNPWDVACADGGRMLCVSLSGTHELALISMSDLFGDRARTMSPMMGVWPIYPSLGESLWRRISLPGKGPRGLAVHGTQIYAAEYFSDTLAVADARSGEDASVGSIALGPPPQLTPERRGELLFHDATLCYQNWQSCASCHPDGRADGLNWDLANDGTGNGKSTKSLLFAHRTPPAMAEGVRASAEEAVRSGITNILFSVRPEEEAAAIDAYLKSLRPEPSPYLLDNSATNDPVVRRVAHEFPAPVDRGASLGNATLNSGGQLSPAARRGERLFVSERVDCVRCHPAPLYTDLQSHNVGSRSPREYAQKFDTPTLVEVWRTAPYLHDGRYATLREVFADGKHGLRRGSHYLKLTDQELNDLVEFVLAL